MGVKFRPLINWIQSKKNRFLAWVNDTNLIIFFSRKLTYIYSFYYLLFILKWNIILSLFIPYIINRLCWDIFITWFYLDYIYGYIYKITDNLKEFKHFYKNLYTHYLNKVYKNYNLNKKKLNFIRGGKINKIIYILIKLITTLLLFIYIVYIYTYIYEYSYIYVYMYIYLFIIITTIFIKTNNYFINLNINLNILYKFNIITYIYTLIIYLLKFLINIIKYVFKYIKILYKTIINYIKNTLITNYIKILNLATNLINDIKAVIHNYWLNNLMVLNVKLILNNYYNKYITLDNKLELYIYLYNKKLIWNKINYKLKLSIIYIVDNLEYNILMNNKFYKKKNIIKLHKKQKNFTPIKSKFETIINIYLTNMYTKLLNLYNNLKLLFKNLINILYNNVTEISYFKIILKLKIMTIKKNKINFNNLINVFNIQINTIYINKIIYYIYSPVIILNTIISDIPLSITYLLIKYNKKYYINILCIYLFKYIKLLLKFFTSKTIHTILYLKKCIYFLISKTIYITLIFCYFYNKDLSTIFLYNIYNTYLFNVINSVVLTNYLNVLFNCNNLYYLITIVGLQIVLYWSRQIHSLFGSYLWTMTIFPIFIETHKNLYYKLICINFLNTNTFDYILCLRYNILEIFNYKIYNIYQFFSGIIILIMLGYFIKKKTFRHLYANFKYSRWSFIKYPILIYLLEIFRLKLVEFLSIFILYINMNYNFNLYFIKNLINISNNYLFLLFIDFIQEYVFEIYDFNYFKLYNNLIPNLYLINFFIDILIFLIALNWLLIYLNKYKKVDLKFVAFPLVITEIFLKYYIIYIISYYFLQYIYIWIFDNTILWHSFRFSLLLLIYLEIRVHKIPRKTMPWYFRQIVELWPSTYMNQWYTGEYLYIDQQRYIVLRFRLKTFKIGYKDVYKKCEIWNKIIILNYQKDKDITLKQLTSFCRVMARKENMLREINNFEYQGWYEDWQYNSNKINIYSWKLDLWDKPYMYQFKKTVFFSNIKFHFFNYQILLERYASKYMHLTYLFFFTNILDIYYTNKYIYIYDRDDISSLNRNEWKKKFYTDFYNVEELIHLKKLKIVLMGFSSGEFIKTPDWIFPPIYEKRYKVEGWSMFEDPQIDLIELDWRPILTDLN